jgi:hypothetical protein
MIAQLLTINSSDDLFGSSVSWEERKIYFALGLEKRRVLMRQLSKLKNPNMKTTALLKISVEAKCIGIIAGNYKIINIHLQTLYLKE